MQIIRISTENEVSMHDFPQGNYSQQNRALYSLIGNNCSMIEHVMPRRLYRKLGAVAEVTGIPGQAVALLVDEEGLLKANDINTIASYLYESDNHGYPIMGNVLLIGKQWSKDGISFCGIEDSTLATLYPQIVRLAKRIGGKNE